MKGDERTGSKTIAMMLKRTGSLSIALLFMLSAVFLAFKSGYEILAYLAVLTSVLILAAIFIKSERIILLIAKLPPLLLTLLAGYFYPVYLLFIVALLFTMRIYYRKRFGIIYPKLA